MSSSMLNTQSINCHRIPAIAASVLSTCSVLLSFGGGLTCRFLKIKFNDPHLDDEVIIADAPIASRPREDEDADEYDMMGILCPSPYHRVDYESGELDRMVQVSRAFLILALAFGVIAAAASFSVTVLITPTRFNWRVISLLTALSAVCQVPVFLLFETQVCVGKGSMGMSDDDVRAEKAVYWSCEAYRGCFIVIASTLGYLAATVVTQCTDPPRWTYIRDSWKVSSVSSDHIDDIPLCDQDDRQDEMKTRGPSSPLDRSSYAAANKTCVDPRFRNTHDEAVASPEVVYIADGDNDCFSDEYGVLGAHKVEVGPTGIEVGAALRVEVRQRGSIRREEAGRRDMKMRLPRVLALGSSTRGTRVQTGPVDLDESLPDSCLDSDAESQRYGILPPPLSAHDPHHHNSAHSLPFFRLFKSVNDGAASGSEQSTDEYTTDGGESRFEGRRESVQQRNSLALSDDTDEVVTTKSITRTGTSAASILAGYVSYVVPHTIHKPIQKEESEEGSIDHLTSEDDKTPPVENKNVGPIYSRQTGKDDPTDRNTEAEGDERTSPTRDSEFSSQDEVELEPASWGHTRNTHELGINVGFSSDDSSSESAKEKKRQRRRLLATRSRGQSSAKKRLLLPGSLRSLSFSMKGARGTNNDPGARRMQAAFTSVPNQVNHNVTAEFAENLGFDPVVGATVENRQGSHQVVSIEVEDANAIRLPTSEATSYEANGDEVDSVGGDQVIVLSDPEFYISTEEKSHSRGLSVDNDHIELGEHDRSERKTVEQHVSDDDGAVSRSAHNPWADPLDSGDVLTTVVASVGDGINMMASSIKFATGGWMIDSDEGEAVGQPSVTTRNGESREVSQDCGTRMQPKTKLKKKRSRNRPRPRHRPVPDVTSNPLSATASIGKKAIGISRTFSKRHMKYCNMDDYDIENGLTDAEDDNSPYKFQMDDEPLLPSLSFSPDLGVSYYGVENHGNLGEDHVKALQSMEGDPIESSSEIDNRDSKNSGESCVENSQPRFVMAETESSDPRLCTSPEGSSEPTRRVSLQANRRRRRRKKKKSSKAGSNSDGSSVSSGTSLLELTIDEETDQELEEFERDEEDFSGSSRASSPVLGKKPIGDVTSDSKCEEEIGGKAQQVQVGNDTSDAAEPSIVTDSASTSVMHPVELTGDDPPQHSSPQESVKNTSDECPTSVDADALLQLTLKHTDYVEKEPEHESTVSAELTDADAEMNGFDNSKIEFVDHSVTNRTKSQDDLQPTVLSSSMNEVKESGLEARRYFYDCEEITPTIRVEQDVLREFADPCGSKLSEFLDQATSHHLKESSGPPKGMALSAIDFESSPHAQTFGPPPPIDSDDDNPEGIFLTNEVSDPDDSSIDRRVVTPSPVERQRDLYNSFFPGDVSDDEVLPTVGLTNMSVSSKHFEGEKDTEMGWKRNGKTRHIPVGESNGTGIDDESNSPDQKSRQACRVDPVDHGPHYGSDVVELVGSSEEDEPHASVIRNVRVRRLQRQQEMLSNTRSRKNDFERPPFVLGEGDF